MSQPASQPAKLTRMLYNQQYKPLMTQLSDRYVQLDFEEKNWSQRCVIESITPLVWFKQWLAAKEVTSQYLN